VLLLLLLVVVVVLLLSSSSTAASSMFAGQAGGHSRAICANVLPRTHGFVALCSG
jgi:preprotein translocase subunit SecG